MSARIQNHISGRLSLRPPQAESLAKLKQALDAAPEMLAQDGRDVAAILSTLKAQFPTLEDFEREFPSLCFALAAGVGKTRLMGAFIAYLHLAHGINIFNISKINPEVRGGKEPRIKRMREVLGDSCFNHLALIWPVRCLVQ